MSWIRKEEISQYRSETEPAPPVPKSKIQNPKSSLFLHVDMDAFFASVEERDNPLLRGLPVAVGGGTGNKGIITAANYVARKYGLRAGMPTIEARRLCPNVNFVGLDARKYTYASAQIMDLLEEFSPDIRILSVDEASLEISGCLKLFGTPEAVGKAVKQAIRDRLDLPSTAGIASNRLVAKVAADCSKPDGLRFIRPGEEADFLAPLKVSKMCGIGPATERALGRFGFQTLGELAAASSDLMKLRFGILGPILIKMAKGEYAGRMMQDDERGAEEKSMGHERTFGEPIENEADLKAWVVALAEMVARRVRQGKVLGRVLTMRLRYTDFETLTHQSVLPEPTDDEEIMILHGWRLLNECWKKGRPVRLLGLSLGALTPKDESTLQMNLFTGKQVIRREALYQALDNLKDRFGEKVILRAMGSKWRVRRNHISFGRAR